MTTMVAAPPIPAIQGALNSVAVTEVLTGQLYFADPDNNSARLFCTGHDVVAEGAEKLLVDFRIEPAAHDELFVTIGIELNGGRAIAAATRTCIQTNLMTALGGYSPQRVFIGPSCVQFFVARLKPAALPAD